MGAEKRKVAGATSAALVALLLPAGDFIEEPALGGREAGDAFRADLVEYAIEFGGGGIHFLAGPRAGHR